MEASHGENEIMPCGFSFFLLSHGHSTETHKFSLRARVTVQAFVKLSKQRPCYVKQNIGLPLASKQSLKIEDN